MYTPVFARGELPRMRPGRFRSALKCQEVQEQGNPDDNERAPWRNRDS